MNKNKIIKWAGKVGLELCILCNNEYGSCDVSFTDFTLKKINYSLRYPKMNMPINIICKCKKFKPKYEVHRESN